MVADIWTLDMNVGNGRFGGLVVSVPATRSHIPGSNLGTGGGLFCPDRVVVCGVADLAVNTV